jgi:MoaA/NifB/PqqE/SkfB family radical SAM enzyme
MKLKRLIKRVLGQTLREQVLADAYERALTPEKKLNEKLNNEEYALKRTQLKSNPTTYVLGLTNICNLRCPLCITGLRRQQKQKKFMDFESAKKIIEKVKDHAICVQLYKWGESLLHRDFVRILRMAKESGMFTQLSTNLNINYDKDLFYALVDAPLDQMMVSFDGLTQETYSRYRVGGDLAKVIENVKLLSKIKKERKSHYPVIDLQFLTNRYNSDEVSALMRDFRDIGADFAFTAETIMPFKCNDKGLARQWLTDAEIENRKYIDVDSWTLYNVCAFLYKFMIVEQDGSIPPCCYTTDPADDFSVFDESKTINEIFNSDRFVRARRLFSDPSAGTDEVVCAQCSVLRSYREKRA